MTATTRMGGMRSTWSLVSALVVLCVAAGAEAAPMTYVFQSGEIRLEASSGSEVLGLSDVATLDGLQVVLDTSAGILNSLVLSSGGPVDLSLNPDYAGFDFISLTDISLFGGPGPLTLLAGGSLEIYSYSIDPLTFSALLDASGPAVPSIDDLAIQSITDGSGLITLDTGSSALFLQGVTIGEFGPLGNESDKLVLKADLVFVGEGVIPEPNGAQLMGLGVLVVGLAGMSRRTFATS